eukprot:TRINITY_DN21042_c0_g1_i1.p1 TRINITY_DN21042_c0_g1~~TRINITY_DN21042_c0_g1_i1.p1  ORF type:complete len:433 (+),score=95.66 TRINITY_DN21042_c0_g1_i1:72-1370(+)
MSNQDFPHAFSEEDENLLAELCGVAEEEGPVEECDAAGKDWYELARRDMERYLVTLEEEEEVVEVKEEDEGLVGGGRTESFGEGWEDDDLGNWQPEKILKRGYKNGVKHYLVKWRSAAEPTWETAEDLEEEGHLPLLKEFDQKRASGKPSNPPRSEKSSQPSAPPRPVKKTLINTFTPEVYWADFQTRIVEAFRHCSYYVAEIHNVCRFEAAEKFTSLWRSSDEGVPVMLFHGTDRTNLGGIVKEGLKIPGKGNAVRVANGSAYGVGIYTGAYPSVSIPYSRGSPYVFVCAGLISGRFSTSVRQPGSMMVFYDEALVLPCFLVKYTMLDVSPKYFPTQTTEWLEEISQPTPPIGASGTASSSPLISDLMARYKNGIAAAADAPPPANDLKGGGEPGMRYSKTLNTLTKKQLRALPRSAKEMYKDGLLKQRKN